MMYKGFKVTVQKYPPPLPLAWAFFPVRRNTAAHLHQVHYRAIWGSQSFGGAVSLAGLLLLWPFFMIRHILDATRRNGDMVLARTGKSKLLPDRRAVMADSAFRLPAALLLHAGTVPAGTAPARGRLCPSLCGQGQPLPHGEAGHPFAADRQGRLCRLLRRARFARRSHPGLAQRRQVVEAGFAGLPPRDLFIKRTTGRGGARAELWRYENGRYHAPDGASLDHDALLAHLLALSAREAYVVQVRQINHPVIADLSPSALATVRLLTLIDEKGQAEPVRALFRMGASKDSIVDNFHAGGIAAPVDLATGRLGLGDGFWSRPQRRLAG